VVLFLLLFLEIENSLIEDEEEEQN